MSIRLSQSQEFKETFYPESFINPFKNNKQDCDFLYKDEQDQKKVKTIVNQSIKIKIASLRLERNWLKEIQSGIFHSACEQSINTDLIEFFEPFQILNEIFEPDKSIEQRTTLVNTSIDFELKHTKVNKKSAGQAIFNSVTEKIEKNICIGQTDLQLDTQTILFAMLLESLLKSCLRQTGTVDVSQTDAEEMPNHKGNLRLTCPQLTLSLKVMDGAQLSDLIAMALDILAEEGLNKFQKFVLENLHEDTIFCPFYLIYRLEDLIIDQKKIQINFLLFDVGYGANVKQENQAFLEGIIVQLDKNSTDNQSDDQSDEEFKIVHDLDSNHSKAETSSVGTLSEEEKLDDTQSDHDGAEQAHIEVSRVSLHLGFPSSAGAEGLQIDMVVLQSIMDEALLAFKGIDSLNNSLKILQNTSDFEDRDEPEQNFPQKIDQELIKPYKITINIKSIDFFLTKQIYTRKISEAINLYIFDESLKALAQVKISDIQLQIQRNGLFNQIKYQHQGNSIKIYGSISNLIFLDFCQNQIQIIQQSLNQKNLFNNKNRKHQQHTQQIPLILKDLQQLQIKELISRYEDNILIYKCQQQQLKKDSKILDIFVQIRQKYEKQIQLNREQLIQLFKNMKEKYLTQDTKDKNIPIIKRYQLELLFSYFQILKMNPQELSTRFEIKNVITRIQPFLNQKINDCNKNDFSNMQSQNFKKYNIHHKNIHQFYENTSLLKEIIHIQELILQGKYKINKNQDIKMKIDISDIQEFKQLHYSDKIDTNMIFKNIGFDFSPNISFKDDKQIFEKEFQNQIKDFSSCQNSVRISYRTIAFFQEICIYVRYQENKDKLYQIKSFEILTKNFSIQVFDLNEFKDEFINIFANFGNIKQNKNQIKNNWNQESIKGDLKDAGFEKVLEIDYFKANFIDDNTKTNLEIFFKQIFLHLEKNKIKALKILKLCFDKNLKQLTRDYSNYSQNTNIQEQKQTEQKKNKLNQKTQKAIKETFEKNKPQLINFDEIRDKHKKELLFEIKFRDESIFNKGNKMINIQDKTINCYIINHVSNHLKRVHNTDRYKLIHQIPQLNSNYQLKNNEHGNQIDNESKIILKPNTSIFIQLQSIDLKLFERRDNRLIQQNNIHLKSYNDKNSSGQDIKDSNKQQKNRIIENYLDHISAKEQKQIRNNSYNNQLFDSQSIGIVYYQILFKNFYLSYFYFQDNDQNRNSQNQSKNFDKLSISMQKILIKENITTRRKMILECVFYPDSIKYDNFVELIKYSQNQNNKQKSGYKIKFQPIKLKIRQEVIEFIFKFLNKDIISLYENKNLLQNNDHLKEDFLNLSKSLINYDEKQIFNEGQIENKIITVSEIQIIKSKISISYSSKKFSAFQLYNQGNKLEFLNILNINDLNFEIKQYDQQGEMDEEQAFQKVVEFYKQDLIQNQNLNILYALGPIKGLVNISAALKGFILKPYRAGLCNGDLIGAAKGFGQGAGELYAALSEEQSNLYKKVSKSKSTRKN